MLWEPLINSEERNTHFLPSWTHRVKRFCVNGVLLRVQFRSFVLKSTSMIFQRLNIPVCHDIFLRIIKFSIKSIKLSGVWLARSLNVSRSRNVYVAVDGGGRKCTHYNLHRTNHMWIHILHFAGLSMEAFLPWLSDPFACEHWLQLLINFRSEVATLFANHARTGLSDVVWTGSVGCWRRLIAESMSFSGYFNFKNIPFNVRPRKTLIVYTRLPFARM